MEKDIALGPEGQLALKLDGGMLVLEVTHKHASGELSVVAKENPDYFIDKLAALIPGKADDMAFAILKAALKGL
jgi:hypothetical protein